MYGRLHLITPPAMEPVTLVEVKLHARIDHDLEDGLLATFIAAACQHGEQLTGRQFVEAAYELSLDDFPCGEDPIELPKPPLQAVESISFVAPDGATQTMNAWHQTRIIVGCPPRKSPVAADAFLSSVQREGTGAAK